MKSRLIYLFLGLSLWSTHILAQFSRGGTTRAVVIGISDYQNDGIPDLQYAHRDALEFHKYLQSSSGGGLKKENIRILVNSEATGGNVHKALYWLESESRPGDKCIIYLSGHGDVESNNNDEVGHFLVYDSPSKTYQINSLRLDDLDRIIKVLTTEKESQVTIYADACRSGALAGKEINGSQATAAAMSQQFSNEVKLLSCQPDQYSVESDLWGGGRGLFSYLLLEGLKGLADANEDMIVTLKEVERYIDDSIESQSSGKITQNPMALGNKNHRLAFIDPIVLDSIKQLNSAVEEVTASTKKQNDPVQLFYKYLESKDYLPRVDGDTANAIHYFKLIAKDAEYKDKELLMRGDFIAALQDEAQKSINLYLNTDPIVMADRFSGDIKSFERYAQYLYQASELMGEFHYLYAQMKAKAIYFDVVSQRISTPKNLDQKDHLNGLLRHLSEAITLQPRSAFINNEMGLIYEGLLDYENALTQYESAINISPTWALPYTNKANTLIALHRYEEALVSAEKSIELEPTYPKAKLAKSVSLAKIGRAKEALLLDAELIKQYPDEILARINYAVHYNLVYDNIDSAIYLSNQVLEMDPNNAIALFSLGGLHINQKKYKKALKYLEKAKSLGSTDPILFENLGAVYYHLKKFDLSVDSYRSALQIDPKSTARIYLGFSLMQLKQYDEVVKELQFYIDEVDPNDQWAYFDLACAYAMKSNLEQFESQMEKAIERGFNSKKEMEESKYLSSIRNSKQYLSIIAKL